LVFGADRIGKEYVKGVWQYMKCRICGNDRGNQSIDLIGVRYGTKGTWSYIRCNKCGLLQIKEIPDNLGKYYDSQYYSMHTEDRSFRSKLWDKLFQYEITGKSLLGNMIHVIFPSDYSFMRNVSKEARILDVGCGDGKRLRQLARFGYKNLSGVEPYIEKTVDIIENDTTITITKSQLMDYNPGERYDYIIFEHSLEHVPDENSMLVQAKKLLAEAGRIVIKLPVFSNYYWEKYGCYQYVLDPPRHLYIHTFNSMKELVENNMLEIESFTTETEPIMKLAVKNIKQGKTERDEKYPFVAMLVEGILSYPRRKKLDLMKDGACATFVVGCKRIEA
jgi:SAM-dependent methyltransferase